MVYSKIEKQKMDRLVEAFRDYIAHSREFDIAYAEKTGYVWLVIAENAEAIYFPLTDYDDMLHSLIADVFADEQERTDKTPDLRRPCEYLQGILSALQEDRDHARNTLEAFYENLTKEANAPQFVE